MGIEGMPAAPQTYWLNRRVKDLCVTGNGYALQCALPSITYRAQPDEVTGEFQRMPWRTWGTCSLTYSSWEEVQSFLNRYFTASPQGLDSMADLYYRNDVSGEAEA